jgi:hypothetical protein
MKQVLGIGLIILSLPFFLEALNNLIFLMSAEEGSIVTGAIPHAIIYSGMGLIPLSFGIILLRKHRAKNK